MKKNLMCRQQIGGEQVAVGVDPSRNALHLAMLAPHGTTIRRLPLVPDSLHSIDAFLRDAQEVRLGVENAASCGALVLLHWLSQGYDVREVNPQVSKRLRECFTEAHTDASDAQGLAWSVRFHPDLPKVRLTVTTAAWKRLARARARLVKTQTGLYNRLHAMLAESYGAAYKMLFPSLRSKKALAFFRDFPTLDDARGDLARVRTLLGEEKAALLEEVGQWGESLYLEVLRIEVRLTIHLLLTYRAAIKELERKMAELSRADPEVERLKTIPGMGTTLALTILGHCGHLSRFPKRDAFIAYCGLAPTIWQSGQSPVYTRRRRRYSRALKQAFLQLALTQLRVNPESRVYYERKRQEGKAHWTALIALARQLAKVVYKMMVEVPPSTCSSHLDIDG